MQESISMRSTVFEYINVYNEHKMGVVDDMMFCSID